MWIENARSELQTSQLGRVVCLFLPSHKLATKLGARETTRT